MVTADEVKYAYRLFLGREPENEEVIKSYCQTTKSLQELSNIFMNSPEFLRRMDSTLENTQVNHHRLPFNLPKIPVETEVSKEILHKMFERIQRQWEHLGSTEPYWSVLIEEHNYLMNFEKNRETFYATGEVEVKNFLASLRRNDINPSNLNTCLEIGCGVGRITSNLAKNFNQVIALDVSESHLEIAKKYLNEKNISNVQTIPWKQLTDINELPEVDALFSLLTFQHNPPPVMVWLLRILLSKLNSGGIAYIQIPTYKNGYIFEGERYLSSEIKLNVPEMHYLPQSEIFQIIKNEDCICLEIREDGMLNQQNRELSNTFILKK